MQDNSLFETASLIALLSMAMVGTTTALMSGIWKSVSQRFTDIRAEERQQTIKTVAVMTIVALLWFGLSTTVGVYWPNYVMDAYFFFMLALIIFMSMIAFWPRKKKISKPQIDTKAFLSLGACVFVAFSIACGLLSLLGVGATALDIHVGPFESDNFEWGKWCLFEGLFFFVAGLSYFGFRYIGDATEYLTNFLPPKQKQKPSDMAEETKDSP